MKDSAGEARRWQRQAEHDLEFGRLALRERHHRQPQAGGLREAAGILDQHYVPTRYPNGLPGGVPFEAFGEPQARTALDDARRFVTLAIDRLAGD